MRIVSGTYRGLQLEALGKGDEAAHLRPTTDRVREAVFNLLAHGGYHSPQAPQEMRVLDLFAGTGAMGLEAASRGAAEVLLVDNGKAAAKLQQANIRRMKNPNNIKALKADATSLPPCPGAPYDLVFADPPYGKGLGAAALKSALSQGWLAPEAVVVLEEGQEIAGVPGFRLDDRRKYADNLIYVLIRI